MGGGFGKQSALSINKALPRKDYDNSAWHLVRGKICKNISLSPCTTGPTALNFISYQLQLHGAEYLKEVGGRYATSETRREHRTGPDGLSNVPQVPVWIEHSAVDEGPTWLLL